MPTLDELKKKYFIGSADVPSGTRVPAVRDGSVVTQLVDGKDFFTAVHGEIDLLTGNQKVSGGTTYQDFVLIANWNPEALLHLPDPRQAAPLDDLATLLAKKAEKGVLVRVLIWFSASSLPRLYVPAYQWSSTLAKLAFADVRPQNNITQTNLWTAHQLRLRQSLRNSVLLDYSSHPLGAHHMKVVAVYNATTDKLVAFCGGMDLESSRGGETYHETAVGSAPGSPLDPIGSLPAPTVGDDGPGVLAAGEYDARYAVAPYWLGKAKLKPWFPKQVSGWGTSPSIAANHSLRASGLGDGTLGQRTVSCYVRKKGASELPRLVPPRREDLGLADAMHLDPSEWGEELTGWEWHDVAVKVEGPAAVDIAEVLRLRWNDVTTLNPLDIDARFLGLEWVGRTNGAPVPMMPEPSATNAAGSLPAGEYSALYTITADIRDEAGTTLYAVSRTAKCSVGASSSITLDNILTAIPAVGKDPDPFYVTKERQVWVWREGTDTGPRLVGTISDNAATEFVVDGDPTTWPATFPSYAIETLAATKDAVQTFPVASGSQSAQVVLTISSISSFVQRIWPTSRPYSFAPQGDFTLYYAYKKAIAAASTYIYVEDQAMGGTELMKLIAARMNIKPDLKVILVTSGISDPADGDNDFAGHYWNDAVWSALIQSIPATSQPNVKFCRSRGLTTHSKIVLIDDEWAVVGSANAANRSFTTDTEMSVSTVDGSGKFVAGLRQTIWAEHLSIPLDHAAYPLLQNLDQALLMWFDPSAVSIAVPTLKRAVEIGPLPVKVKSVSIFNLQDWLQLTFSDYASESFPPVAGASKLAGWP
jgi:phosphatidylserine/phosphatidylglycerophosphate/cardiolipin synthase-like enzyme